MTDKFTALQNEVERLKHEQPSELVAENAALHSEVKRLREENAELTARNQRVSNLLKEMLNVETR